jgi:multiple sugar transport system ATP-binding protein
VADFVGSPAMNLLDLEVTDGGVRFGNATHPVARTVLGAAGTGRVTLGVRPEDLEPAAHGLPVEVAMVEELGADAYVYGTTDVAGASHDIVARVDGRRPPAKGEVVHFAPRPGRVHLFSLVDGRRLSDDRG